MYDANSKYGPEHPELERQKMNQQQQIVCDYYLYQ